MYYTTGKEKTKEDYEILLQEIKAYRSLDGQDFQFSNELVINDGEFHYGSEDGYLGIEQQYLEEIIHWWDWCREPYKYKVLKYKLNRYYKKQLEQKKLKKLSKIAWPMAYFNEDKLRYVRCYLSGSKGYAKWCSKRKVRNVNDFPLVGNGYRKVFDYWNTIF